MVDSPATSRAACLLLGLGLSVCGCLLDFSGYRTGTAAGSDAGHDAAVGGAGGAGEGGAQAGGAGQGGEGQGGEGQGGTGQGGMGQGGTGQGGMGQGGTGQGGEGQGGTGQGGAAGFSGSAGTGGSACTFDACKVVTTHPIKECNDCTLSVCTRYPFCCDSGWSHECVLEASVTPACNCPGLGCGDSPPGPGAGGCLTGYTCNPVAATGCAASGQQCVLDATSGQAKYNCQTVGLRNTCQSCAYGTADNCAAGLSCVAERCVRLCCDAMDCQGTTTCVKGILPGAVGLCTGS